MLEIYYSCYCYMASIRQNTGRRDGTAIIRLFYRFLRSPAIHFSLSIFHAATLIDTRSRGRVGGFCQTLTSF